MSEGWSPSASSPWRLSRSRSLSPSRGRLSRPLSRSLSPPSAPQEKEEKMMMSLYMFFDHGVGDIISLSLCTVEIPSVDSLCAVPSFHVPPIPIRILPTLLFCSTDFPTTMHCMDELYPSDVYIYDPATTNAANVNPKAAKDAKDVVTRGPRMKTGKPTHFYLFVAYGKIYALSTPTTVIGGSDVILIILMCLIPKPMIGIPSLFLLPSVMICRHTPFSIPRFTLCPGGCMVAQFRLSFVVSISTIINRNHLCLCYLTN